MRSSEPLRRPLTWLSRLGRHEIPILLCVVALSGGLWIFVELADEIGERDTRRVDEAVLIALRTPSDHADPLGPKWIEETARDITALGGVAVLVLFGLVALGYLLIARSGRAALFTVVAIAGGWLLSSLLKTGYDRPRPDLVPHEALVYTASFPSGHAMMSAITYLTLAALLSRTEPRWRLKAYLLLSAIIISILVGISRVYLGVHWPTDVLAGWSLGAAWASVCWLLYRWLQRRGSVQDRGEDDTVD